MDYRKILGILYIILGIIFIVYPIYSAEAVSLIAGVSLIVFGFASIISGFSVWSALMQVSAANILLGILAVIMGVLFLYDIDALSFLLSFQFFIIAFIMMFIGLFGLVYESTSGKLASIGIMIMGIIFAVLAAYSLAEPLYAAIFVGVCLIIGGIATFIEE